MKSVIHNKYLNKDKAIQAVIESFDASEERIIKQNRNTLKLFQLGDKQINVKSFKVPNIFNQVVYKYFRKGKAQRSFEYAEKLIEFSIGTPQPIAYFEDSTNVLFGRSYYVSEQLHYDLTYRELITDFDYPDYDNILRAFTRFTFELHEKGIEFLDHSPGNTLIVKEKDTYKFYLVDLNRMKFGTLDFTTRMTNFARLSKHKSMVETMSDEYAKCVNRPYDLVFNTMWNEVQKFRASIERKKKLKKRFLFRS
jgi:hypothetical protein